MVILRSEVLLLMSAHLPVAPNGGKIANGSGPLLNVALYVALVELALAAVVALACGLTLVVAGVLTTANLRRNPRGLTHVASDSDAEEEPWLASLESIVGVGHPRRT